MLARAAARESPAARKAQYPGTLLFASSHQRPSCSASTADSRGLFTSTVSAFHLPDGSARRRAGWEANGGMRGEHH